MPGASKVKFKKQARAEAMRRMGMEQQLSIFLGIFRSAGMQVTDLAQATEALATLLEAVGLPVVIPESAASGGATPPPMVLPRVPEPVSRHLQPRVEAPVAAPAAPPVARAVPQPPRAQLQDFSELDDAFPQAEEEEGVRVDPAGLLTAEQVLAKFSATARRAEAEGISYRTGGGGSSGRKLKIPREEQIRNLQAAGIQVGDPKPSPVIKPQT